VSRYRARKILWIEGTCRLSCRFLFI